MHQNDHAHAGDDAVEYFTAQPADLDASVLRVLARKQQAMADGTPPRVTSPLPEPTKTTYVFAQFMRANELMAKHLDRIQSEAEQFGDVQVAGDTIIVTVDNDSDAKTAVDQMIDEAYWPHLSAD